MQSALAAVDAAKFEQAEEHARSALDLDPRDARARAVLGLALLQRAKRATPPALYDRNRGDGETLRASRLAPADPVVGRLRGQFLAEVGHLSAAAAAAEATLALAPAGPDRLRLRRLAAEWRYELGEEHAAATHFRAFVGERSDDADAWYKLGRCLLAATQEPLKDDERVPAQRAAEEAAEAFAKSAALRPDDREAHAGVGTAHARAAELAPGKSSPERERQLEAAAASFTAAAAKFADDAGMPFRLGVVAEERQRLDEARAAYEEALRREPAHVPSLLNLARLRGAGGDPDGEKELLRRALAADEARGGLTKSERDRIARSLAQ